MKCCRATTVVWLVGIVCLPQYLHADAPLTAEPAVAVRPAAAPVATTDEAVALQLTGIVVSPDGTPIADATVMITDDVAVTGEDGRFVLKAGAGTYVVYVMAAGYKDAEVTVRLRRGTKPLRIVLQPTDVADESITVAGRIDTRDPAAMLAERRTAANLTDGVSAKEISKAPDSNAADAAKRMVAVSVLEGKYVAVRGLDGRYVTTTLNGIVLPSPDPDRSAVPLDLFGTGLLASMVVHKSYAAELPSQFAGGTLALQSNSYPTKREMKVAMSLGTNTDVMRETRVAPASAANAAQWFGFSGGRGLPSAVPRDTPVRGLSAEETTNAARSLPNSWSTNDAGAMGTMSLSVSTGDSLRVGKRPLGYLASLMVRQGGSDRQGESGKTALVGGTLEPSDSLRYLQGEREASIGGVANVAHEIAEGQSISLLGLYTHVGEDLASTTAGYSDSDGRQIEATRLSYLGRSMGLTHLVGTHKLAPELEVGWQAHWTQVGQDELDTRDLVYTLDPATGTRRYKDQPGSGQRYFAGLSDRTLGAQTDVRLRTPAIELHAAVGASSSVRDFAGRRFRNRFVGDDGTVLNESSNTLFASENLGAQFRFEETTLQEDAYASDTDLLWGFAQHVGRKGPVSWSGGARWEWQRQSLDSGTIYAVSGTSIQTDNSQANVLPNASATIELGKNMSLRGAYSYTLARPRLRELAPLLYFDPIRRRSVSGNPELETTRIHNADLRFERYIGESGLVALSVFGKRFEKPIEQVMINSQSDIQFQNAATGDLLGAELEARIDGANVSKSLGWMRVGANVAWMNSSVAYAPNTAALLTTPERALYGQSDYLVNAVVETVVPEVATLHWFYNVSGKRIVDVGIQGIPDTYEQPMHRFDVTAVRSLGNGFKAKLSVANLLMAEQQLTQDSVVVGRAETGLSMGLGLEWSPETKEE